MASIIHQFTVTIPAGTAKATPYSAALALPMEQLESVDIEVPPGPRGLMGFYLAQSGQQVIPWESGQWIVWDDRFATWYIAGYQANASWSVVGYNLDGVNTHSLVVRFHDNPLVTTSATPPTITTAVASPPAGAVTTTTTSTTSSTTTTTSVQPGGPVVLA